jgi:hypothetical protein
LPAARRAAKISHVMSEDTIALQLERDRLAHRLRRIELVTASLRERAVYRHTALGKTPAPLRDAIKTFELECEELHRRLRGIRGG